MWRARLLEMKQILKHWPDVSGDIWQAVTQLAQTHLAGNVEYLKVTALQCDCLHSVRRPHSKSRVASSW